MSDKRLGFLERELRRTYRRMDECFCDSIGGLHGVLCANCERDIDAYNDLCFQYELICSLTRDNPSFSPRKGVPHAVELPERK